MSESNREFGDLLTQGLKSIAARENKSLLVLEDFLGGEMGVTRFAIEKWRQGSILPDAKYVDYLARVCVQRGGMSQHWLRRFLTQARFPDKETLVHELFPIEEPAEAPIKRNFPRRPYEKFVGRERELAMLQQFLSPRHRHGVICLSGAAGVGKTALAVEIAHFYYEQYTILLPEERFEAIVWVTAKQIELLPKGPAVRRLTFTDLDGVYRALAEVLDLPAITRAAANEDRDLIVARALSEHHVLLIMDNLEDIDDPSLMVFLRDLPTPSKAIVTTRHRIDVAVPLQLHAFNEKEARELIRVECQKHKLSLTPEQAEKLLLRTGCLALAIVRTIGRMAWRGSSIEVELQQLGNPANSIYDFCFERSIAPIRGSDAHKLFMALALFPIGATRDTLGHVAGFQEDALDRDEGLSSLEVLSLVNKDGDRFSLEALTQVKAQAELDAHPGFEQEIRGRWIEWYLNFAKRYGGKDWIEWRIQYDRIEEEWANLLAVFHWCAEHDRYDALQMFWGAECVFEFAHTYGYWNDRLFWLDRLIQVAERREDCSLLAESLLGKAYTQTLMSQLDDADKLYMRAWKLRKYLPPSGQANLAQEIANLRIYQRQYADAEYWFDQARTLLGTNQMEELEHARRHVTNQFYYGRMCYEQQSFDQAETLFQEVIEIGSSINWQRAVIYAQNCLADIAIIQGKLDEAESQLRAGLEASDRNKDKRRSAFFKSSFAHLYSKRKNLKEASRWTREALDGFERLGMQLEAKKMRELLEQLE